MSSPPERGALAAFDAGETQFASFGSERWIDATYVPVDASLEPDPFSVTAAGPGGDGPVARMAITPRELPENGGGHCGWWGSEVTKDVPSTLTLVCGDDDGDPLSVEALTEPQHGTITPPVVTIGRFGESEITIPYAPEPGYEGYDCLK